MERLTFKNGDDCWCVRNDHCYEEQSEHYCGPAIDLLAAYEDTGLTPEICANYKKFEDEAISKGVTFNRIVELMEAEKDGRLLVLPCRAGDTVYEVCNNTDACNDCPFYYYGFGDAWCEKIKDIELRDHPHIAEKPLCEKQFMEAAEHTPDISWIFRHRGDFGKTVFLTREEAEAALKRLQQPAE